MRRALMMLGLVALLASPAAALAPIQTDGNPVQGTLDATDTEYMPPGPSRANPSYYRDVYTFEAPATAYVDILLNSSFDGYLYLFGPDNQLIEQNDDYQSTRTSRIATNLTQPGTHYIVVTSFGTGATGTYDLTVSDQDADAIEGVIIQGTIDSSDTEPVLGNYNRSDLDYYRDVYPGPGIAGQMVTIDLRSDFDGYLYLIGPDGEVVAYDDDYGSTRASRIENAIFPTTGTYQIVVTTFSRGNAGGNYTLTIGNPQEAPPPPPVSDDVPISPMVPVNGQLQPGDNAALPASEYRGAPEYCRDGYTFQGTQGQALVINASYVDFDGYLFLVGPDGQITDRNDDYQGTRASRISTTLTQTGTHRIVVTTYGPGATGSYTLTFELPTVMPAAPQPPQQSWGAPTSPPPPQAPQAPQPPQQPSWSPAPVATPAQLPGAGNVTVYDTPSGGGGSYPRLSVGETVQGQLQPGDISELPSNFNRHDTYLNDRYVYMPSNPGQERIVLNVATNYLARVYLCDPFGNVADRADAIPPVSPVRLETDGEYEANYTIYITSEEPNSMGTYTLTLTLE